MGDVTDYDRPDRPSTAQPPPGHVPGAASVHDLVAAEIAARFRAGADHPAARLIAERRAFGLAKYGTVLQVADPNRRAELDALEELGDGLVYAYRAREQDVDGAAYLYERLLELTVWAARRWYPGGTS